MIPPLNFWHWGILVLAAIPLIYYLVAIFAALQFFRRGRPRLIPEYTPPVSILKPVHGVDFASYENFSSFCAQDYPKYEILFGVNDASDPAVALIQRLIAAHPGQRIKLFIGAPQLGANRKVNML